MNKEGLKQYLRSNGLAYMTVEALYENALYVPFVVRQRAHAIVRGLRTGGFRLPAGQSVISWDVPFPECDQPNDLAAWLRSQDVTVRMGGHTLYIPPQPALRRLIPSVVDFYPAHAGFKILRDFRDPMQARYIYKHPRSLSMLNRLIGAPRDQLIAANYMHALGIGPRVWDLCCWRAPAKSCTVFVVDHVAGRQPTIDECNEFLVRLERLKARTHLRILVPGWRQSMDFQPPDCNCNLVYSPTLGGVQYVDFQNFGLTDRCAWWTDAAGPLGKAWSSVAGPVRDATVRAAGRMVLHVGCGDGRRLQAALVRGATWAIGWDRADVLEQARARLLSRGAARFTLIPTDTSDPRALLDEVARNLRPLLSGAVVFFQAARAGRASLESVFELPWSVLVCEGNPSESPGEITSRLHAFARASRGPSLHVVASTEIASESGTRVPLVVVRRPDVTESLRAGVQPAG